MMTSYDCFVYILIVKHLFWIMNWRRNLIFDFVKGSGMGISIPFDILYHCLVSFVQVDLSD